jgi:hypothetical protein
MAATPLRGPVSQRGDRPLAQCSLKAQRVHGPPWDDGRSRHTLAQPSLSVIFVVARLRQCERPCRASLLVALRAAQPTHHVLQLGIPSSETGERMRHAAASVATQARKQNFVLPEFIA